MYYSDSRFVCNAENCKIRTRENHLLQFQTIMKGKLVTLGFHQDCGLPKNAQKCKMADCHIYLDTLYLSKVNRKILVIAHYIAIELNLYGIILILFQKKKRIIMKDSFFMN